MRARIEPVGHLPTVIESIAVRIWLKRVCSKFTLATIGEAIVVGIRVGRKARIAGVVHCGIHTVRKFPAIEETITIRIGVHRVSPFTQMVGKHITGNHTGRTEDVGYAVKAMRTDDG